MSTLRVYKATMPSVNFIMPNGKPVIFVNSVYYTDNEQEIATLDYEIKQGHPHIFIDSTQKEIESEDLNPMVALKKGVVAQMTREELVAALQAKEAAAIDPSNDMGTSDQSSVKPASTQDVAPAAAGGSGASLTASLKNLKVGK
jgi:hypothetical protein